MFCEVLIFVIAIISGITTNGTEIFIGGIFDGPNSNNEIAFKIIADKINDQGSRYTIKPTSIFIDNTDVINIKQDNTNEIGWNKPYTVLKSACSMLDIGISSIFTYLSKDNSDAIQSLCDAKEIPLVQTMMNDKHERECCCSINLYPQTPVLTTAYIDLIKKWEWKSFIIIYQEEESLPRISELLKIYNSGGKLILRHLYLDQNKSYLSSLKSIRNTGQTNFVLICKTESLFEILNQAQQVGLVMEDYSYIIINIDMHTIDLSPFQYSAANITGFRLINPLNPAVVEFVETLQKKRQEAGLQAESFSPYIAAWKLQTSTALLADGVTLFSEVLKDVGDLTAKSLSCNSEEEWEHGMTIFNFMKTKTIDGLTGQVEFNQQGFRTNFTLDLIELTEGGIIKVGSWNSEQGLIISKTYTSDVVNEDISMRNKSFNIGICLVPPYAMLKDISKPLKGNDQYEGFAIDLISEIAEVEDFNYTFISCYDGKNGVYDEITETWSGLIANVLDESADFGIADLTINREREKFVDFSSPFMSLGVQILYKKPTQSTPKFFSFADPLAPEVWLLIGVTFFGMSFMFFIIGRICPAEWYNPCPCLEDPPHLVNQYGFNNCMWLTLGNLMQEGTEIAPRGTSTRLLASFWSFFILIMVSCYTANMAAFLTAENEVWAFTDVRELVNRANKLGITYGSVAGGATYKFFEESSFYSEVGDYMKNHPEVLAKDNVEGTEWALEKNYAFFMESTSINYIVERECNLTAVGDFLDERFYAIAMKKNSPYRNKISATILHLKESGIIDELERKWWKRERGGGECTKSSTPTAKPLNYRHVVGIFWITFVGSVWACVWVVLEMIHKIFKKIKNKQQRFAELQKEIKFYCKFEKRIKPIIKKDVQEETLLDSSE